ncbi:hypothetical protein NESM_000472900 [Novymonas esmeraldas]|uniref:Kinesin n=1 Tax=Novymonas esmeraldas TaxID=1808958 RepID=A0AAW0EPR2_9TRYP
MDRFRTSLCLNGVRTADGVELRVTDAQTLSLHGRRVAADDVVERALPSKVATAMVSSMAAAPAHSHSMFLLLGKHVHHGRLGDAVVHYVIRDQARHRSALYERQVALRPVVTAVRDRSHSAATPLQYEECLLFAYDEGAVACETLRAADAAETVDEVLRTLRLISLAVFKYAENKTCAVLVGSHLSTAHMAALLLAARRHVFLYVDETMSSEEVLSTTAEMQQVRQSLCTFAVPVARDEAEASRAVIAAGGDCGAPALQMSRTLEAVAHSEEEYEVLLAAVVREWAAQSSPAGALAAPKALHEELKESRAAQRAAEAALAEQRRLHREELLSLHAELQSAQRQQHDRGAVVSHVRSESAAANGGEALPPNPPPETVAQLQRALQEALKAQQFAEEKTRLLELRQSLTLSNSSAALTGGAGDSSGAVVTPRPSLRLPPATPPAPAAAWEQTLLQQENTALVAEFQRKEKMWQQRLRHASAEVAQLQQERASMEATLRLQSQTIAAAQQALVDSHAAHEREMHEVLERVRLLSQESRSRHRSRTLSADASHARSAVPDEAASASSFATIHRPAHHRTTTTPTPPPPASSSATGVDSGGMMSPSR